MTAVEHVDQHVDLGPLVSQLGDDVVVTDAERMDKYRWDRAQDPGAGVPLAVVRARSTEDVQAAKLELVVRAAEHGTSAAPGTAAPVAWVARELPAPPA